MSDETIPVLAPAVHLSITIEAGTGDEIHLHAGGQGVWVARMLRRLGHAPIVCAPVGGEIGRAFVGLTAEWDLQLQAVKTARETSAYVLDRRAGQQEVARSAHAALGRHEADELYNQFLQLALDAGRCVVTGPEGDDPYMVDLFRRLGADLDAADVDVVADLHGPELDAFLHGGPLRILKVSAGDLVKDGLITEDERDDEDMLRRICKKLRDRGAAAVVVSRGGAPILASTPEGRYEVTGPALEPVATEGSGDAMTAGLMSSLVQSLDTPAMLARAWAAGAANVTRRGLGSGDAGLIDRLAERATVREGGSA